ncbi:hypothetical protein Golax_005726, partial [Gossypium laxum]|nr:hypothetical protein [Gossypium laxum]
EPQKAALPNSAAKSVPSITASSDSSSEEDSDEEDVKKAIIVNKASAPTPKKNEDSSSSSSDDCDSEEEMKVEAKKPVNGKTSKKEYSSGSSSETDSSEDEFFKSLTLSMFCEQSMTLFLANFPFTLQESDDSEDDSSDESEDEQPAAKKSKVAPDSGKAAKVKKVSSSEEEESEESSDDDEESEDEKFPKKKDTDVEMLDATTPQKNAKQQDVRSGKKAPQTPATPQVQSTGSKTSFVGNLSFQIEQDEMYLVDIRLATDAEGNFKGYGHVEFATAEAAQKALELNGEYLMNRAVRLDLARERVAYTPHSSNGNNSFQKGGRGNVRTIYVRGFDQSLGQDEIKNSLKEHFGPCGEISRVAIPVDWETGGVKGYVSPVALCLFGFQLRDSFNKALVSWAAHGILQS